ncbi:MAG: TRAP transporter small permease subunit [Deltaproteobacteria bacterium]|nr:MAG: TRAP transporter small permease subunit [Deltaproteobacteria bacterium]
MSMKKLVEGFLFGAAKLTDWTSIFLMAFITVQLIIVVVLRYVFFTNIRWFEQSSSILFFYVIFIPAGLLSRSNQHLNVEVLWEYLQKREKKKALWILHLLLRLTEALFCALALYLAWEYTVHLIEINATFDYEFFGRRVPQWTTSVAFILGFFFLLLFTVEVLITSLMKKKI